MDVLCEAAKTLGWKHPTKIQREAIPVALEGRVCVITLHYTMAYPLPFIEFQSYVIDLLFLKDIIGLAETGSGKTGAFALPMLQVLLFSLSRHLYPNQKIIKNNLPQDLLNVIFTILL